MLELLETYHSAGPAAKPALLRKIAAELKRAGAEDAAAALRQLVNPALDYAGAATLSRLRKSLPRTSANPLKLAVLAGFTSRQLADFIDLFLFALGIEAEIYESDYDVFRQEILDPSSGLHAFHPAVLFLAMNRRNLGRIPAYEDSPERVRELVAEETARWSALWQTAQERFGCQIVQNNYDAPPARILGNHEMRHHAGWRVSSRR